MKQAINAKPILALDFFCAIRALGGTLMRTTRCDKGVSRIYNAGGLPVGGLCHPSGACPATIAEAEAAVQQHASGQTRGPGRSPTPSVALLEGHQLG